MISVIIPTYNRENTIIRAIQSVLNQTYTDIEVIVVDDGSTDMTGEKVRNIGDERVKYILLDKNSGPSNARNIGVLNAKGEWIAFQDSDDAWYADKLEKQIVYAEENTKFALIYCSYRLITASEKSYLVPPKQYERLKEGNILNSLLLQNVIGTPTILVRKDVFERVGGFDSSYKALEDWEFVLRVAREYEIGFVPEVLVDAYLLSGGVSSNVSAYYESRCMMLTEYRKEMENAGVFDIVLMDIFESARQDGILKEIKRMVMFYLTKV